MPAGHPVGFDFEAPGWAGGVAAPGVPIGGPDGPTHEGAGWYDSVDAAARESGVNVPGGGLMAMPTEGGDNVPGGSAEAGPSGPVRDEAYDLDVVRRFLRHSGIPESDLGGSWGVLSGYIRGRLR